MEWSFSSSLKYQKHAFCSRVPSFSFLLFPCSQQFGPCSLVLLNPWSPIPQKWPLKCPPPPLPYQYCEFVSVTSKKHKSGFVSTLPAGRGYHLKVPSPQLDFYFGEAISLTSRGFRQASKSGPPGYLNHKYQSISTHRWVIHTAAKGAPIPPLSICIPPDGRVGQLCPRPLDPSCSWTTPVYWLFHRYPNHL